MKGFRFAVIIIFAFCICSAGFSQEQESPSVVTIEKALKTSYIKDKEKDTEIIKFSGDVIISVEKDGKKVVIRAETVNVDRKRNVLYASGNVRMEKISSNKISESISSESVLLNTDTLEGIFIEGRVSHEEQKSVKLPDGARLIVSSELLSRDGSETVTFKNGELTFCDDENPHWKIKASRIWLLPGNEFAFANALLYVGSVPLMYFPFFYYPKDELFFNPSFGYRPREGYFVQTTTYFIGRKALQSDDKAAKGFNFMQPTSLYEQELEGLILHNLNKEASAPPYFLKFMADYYSTLGGMAGIAGDFKPAGAVKSLSFDVRLGFSNTVYPIQGYNQYISYGSQKRKNTDYGWFFGVKMPFRYRVSLKTSVQKNGFSLNAALPLYSDPYFAGDFGDRKESMDWIDFFLKGAFSGAGKTNEVGTVSSSALKGAVSSYTWNISGSYTPSIPAVRPLIESVSVSSFGSSVVFSQQRAAKREFNDDSDWYTNSPNRDFFYPVQIKPLSFGLTLSGTLVNWPVQKKPLPEKELKSVQIKNTDLMRDKTAVPENLISDSGNSNDTDKNQKDDLLFKIESLPDIPVSVPAGEKKDILSYKLGYSFKPDFSSLFMYSPQKMTVSNETYSLPQFFIQNPNSSEVGLKLPLDLNSNLLWYGSLLSVSNTVSLLYQYQTHPILSSAYTLAERNRIILNDYNARKLNIANTNAFTLKPLISFPVFKDSALSWNTGMKFLHTSFSGSIDKPAWTYHTPEWNKKTFTNHNLHFVLSAKEGAFSQSLSFRANLPPLTDSYTAKAEFTFPLVNASLESAYVKRENSLKSDWYFLPLVQISSWTFFKYTKDGKDNKNKLTLAQRFDYNINDKHAERLTVGLGWRNMRFAYEMMYGYSYVLDISRGWVTSEKKSFLPYLLTFHANIPNLEFKNKSGNIGFNPSLSTVLSWNIAKPTDSYFTFTPSFTFKINKFLNLTFSAESRNKELLRYVQKAVGFEPEIPGERNIFIDLFNSFAFWDEQKRNASGFKIKRLSVKLEHDLHDWILNSEFKVEPRIIGSGTNRKYDYKPYFTLSVQWKPLQGIKTVIHDEYGDFILNPAK
ncbi:hypothetical protein V1L52_07705 [Treponema sp. HNW]|uniref:hypothetical protein n=1 Tax=Treponema sp. HNW TaxID=3116654 RepID=UPI003D0AE149